VKVRQHREATLQEKKETCNGNAQPRMQLRSPQKKCSQQRNIEQGKTLLH
jgi:hypothetical protein